MHYIISSFGLLLLLVCNNEPITIDFSQEVQALKTTTTQRIYLENIYDEDQGLRKAAASEKGMERIPLNKIHLAKIEAYLAIHGNPSIEQHSEKAAMTPWIVIHHTRDVEVCHRNFKYLYQAWKTGDIDGGNLTFYLNRMYDIKFGHRMQLKNPFREEFEMDTLIRSLDLQHIRKEVDRNLDKIEE